MKAPEINKTKLPRAMEIIEQAAELMAEKHCDLKNGSEEDKKALAELQEQLRELTGKADLNITELNGYWGWGSLEEAARMALTPKPQKSEVSDDKIREIVVNILKDPSKTDYWVNFLKVNTGLDNVSDYIFYPDEVGLDETATLEEIADKIITDRK